MYVDVFKKAGLFVGEISVRPPRIVLKQGGGLSVVSLFVRVNHSLVPLRVLFSSFTPLDSHSSCFFFIHFGSEQNTSVRVGELRK